MTRFAWVAVLCLIVPVTRPAVAQRPAQADLASALQPALDRARDANGLPGVSVAVVLPDDTLVTVTSGFADLAARTRLTPTNRLLAGSIGKTFVAAEALLLAEEGAFGLDDRVSKWLGQAPWFAAVPNAGDLTVRMLLNHTSGIPNHVDDARFQRAIFKKPLHDVQYAELLTYIRGARPLFAAGHGFHYADTNYILAGLAIEKATGQRLYDEIERRLLRPLHLDRTMPSDRLRLPDTGTGYLENRPVVVKGEFIVNPQWEWAGGGFASTAGDLARWARALYGGDVLSAASRTEMLDGVATGDGSRYGLGVELTSGVWGPTTGHDGEFPGYLSDMRYFPARRIAIALQINADETAGAAKFMGGAIDDVARIVIGSLPHREVESGEAERIRSFAESWLRQRENRRREAGTGATDV